MIPTNSHLESCRMADMHRIAERNRLIKRRFDMLLTILIWMFAAIVAVMFWNYLCS